MFFGKRRLGIDLGTSNTVIYIDNKGIALREPSIVAIHKESGKAIAFGREVSELEGRHSDQFNIIRPIKEGVIANFELTKQMLHHYMKKAVRRSFVRSEVVICVPSKISKVEKKAVIDTIKDLGIQRAMIVEEPFAAAVGNQLNINEAKGKMVCDIGGGGTDIATISFGEIIHAHTIRAGGNLMNEAIQAYIREKYQKIISFQTAEKIKIQMGTVANKNFDSNVTMEIQGQSVATGLPENFEISEEDISLAIEEVIIQIIIGLKNVLELTAPELAVDIMETGIILSGGGALLRSLPDRLQEEIGIAVHIGTTPMDSVAIGAGKLIHQFRQETKRREKMIDSIK